MGEKTPSDWMKNSIVWYSQIITYKLGLKKFQEYLKKFNYGNMNTSGKDAIRMGWLTASSDKDGYIKISPEEQINFIENILHKNFQIKSAAYDMVRKLASLALDKSLANGEKIYGKTGTCNQIKPDGTKNQNRYHGWFVGWTEVNIHGASPVVFSRSL